MKRCLLGLSTLLLVALAAADANAQSPYCANCCQPSYGAKYCLPWRAQAYTTWHGAFYDPAWGAPVALVVPPTATLQTKQSWGVANTEVVPIHHQFHRGWPGPYVGGYGFMPTPPIPGHTDQFGVYYVRGPW